MRVGVLGSGTVGQTLAGGFLKHGHQVVVGTRDPGAEDLRGFQTQAPGVKVGSFQEAARFGELLVLSVLARVVADVIRMAGEENFRDKTLIDTNNPISDQPMTDGVLSYFTGPNQSLAENIQKLLPATHVIKAFNSVGAGLMVNPSFEQGTPTMFICGNNAQAKAQVKDLLRQFGWEAFDCGSIVAARAIEPLCMLWCIPGFRSNDWMHAFKMLTQ